jgi:microcystin-dependent protein
MEGYIAEIRMFAGNFEPKNWAFCSGQILAISTNQALFSLIGTYYGGNGVSNFQLPDLRGRVAVGVGPGSNLPPIVLGEQAGKLSATLTQNELPTHTHTATATVTPKAGTGKVSLVSDPTNNFMGQTPAATPIYTATPTANVFMGSNSVNVQIATAGSGQSFSIMQPYLGMNYIICLYGIFPSRN